MEGAPAGPLLKIETFAVDEERLVLIVRASFVRQVARGVKIVVRYQLEVYLRLVTRKWSLLIP